MSNHRFAFVITVLFIFCLTAILFFCRCADPTGIDPVKYQVRVIIENRMSGPTPYSDLYRIDQWEPPVWTGYVGTDPDSIIIDTVYRHSGDTLWFLWWPGAVLANERIDTVVVTKDTTLIFE